MKGCGIICDTQSVPRFSRSYVVKMQNVNPDVDVGLHFEFGWGGASEEVSGALQFATSFATIMAKITFTWGMRD